MLPLFAYGTLRDPEYQLELFARTFAMELAEVSGFVVLSTGGGYLAATPRPGTTIRGALVALDAAAYAVADAWEDLAVYDRITVDARRTLDRVVQRCFMYVVPEARGTPVVDERPADRSRAEVVADIRRFVAASVDITVRR
jgi:gamma-glutamylcyclotransferase (GGCT)/AIG2-like uncharacterized protein YtfP